MLSRMYTGSPHNSECVFKDASEPCSWSHQLQRLESFKDTPCQTYHEACQKRQLLLDDQHFQQALQEATETSTAARLRTLFAIILSYCEPANPRRLWDLFRNHMAEDILYRLQQETIPT